MRETESHSLPARQVRPSLCDQRLIPRLEIPQVLVEARVRQALLVEVRVERPPKNDVVPDAVVDQPGLLTDIDYFSVYFRLAVLVNTGRMHFSQHSIQQR